MEYQIVTKSDAETKKTAEILAKEILNKYSPSRWALVIGLEGELGSGKTAFSQGFAKGLGIKDKITSPTFVILKRYAIGNKRLVYFYHIDCYRLKKSQELLGLGFEKIIKNPRNIALIEWADKIEDILPEKRIRIRFIFKGANTREIILEEISNSC